MANDLIDKDYLKWVIDTCKKNKIGVDKTFKDLYINGYVYTNDKTAQVAELMGEAFRNAYSKGLRALKLDKDIKDDIEEILKQWAVLDNPDCIGDDECIFAMNMINKYPRRDSKMKEVVLKYLDETIEILELQKGMTTPLLAETAEKAIEKLNKVRNNVTIVVDDVSKNANDLAKQITERTISWRETAAANLMITPTKLRELDDMNTLAETWRRIDKIPSSKRDLAKPADLVKYELDEGFMYSRKLYELKESFAIFGEHLNQRSQASTHLDELIRERDSRMQKRAELDSKVRDLKTKYDQGLVSADKVKVDMQTYKLEKQTHDFWLRNNQAKINIGLAYQQGIGTIVERYKFLHEMFNELSKQDPQVCVQTFADIDLNRFINVMDGVRSREDIEEVISQLTLTINVIKERAQQFVDEGKLLNEPFENLYNFDIPDMELAQTQEEKNTTEEQVDNLFAEWGLSEEEGKKEEVKQKANINDIL